VPIKTMSIFVGSTIFCAALGPLGHSPLRVQGNGRVRAPRGRL
jgi:hypothetical protein